MLAGGNRESVIAEAIQSADQLVDSFLLIDTGESAQEAIAVARTILGDRCAVRKFEGEFDCATARNFALDCAGDTGADWALILDTDERMRAEPDMVRRMLSEVQTETVLVAYALNSYKKTRFVRLPHTGRWDGIVHEAYLTGPTTLAKGMTFWELPKTVEEDRERTKWIAAKCREGLEANPDCARYHYYLGDALSQLGEHSKAAESFLAAHKLSDWAEEVEWSLYRAAASMASDGRDAEAVELLTSVKANAPELPWYAAYLANQLGDNDRAVALAQEAIELGKYRRESECVGFSCKFAWYDGPYDVLVRVARDTGNTELEQYATNQAVRLRSDRLRAMVS